MKTFLGYHSEWNLGSPGGWDYQRINQEIGKKVWDRYFAGSMQDLDLDFDNPVLHPVFGFVALLAAEHKKREGKNPGLIGVVAEEETLEDVVENRNLVKHLDAVDGLSGALLAPHELEINNGHVCLHGRPVSLLFVDFNTDVLLTLHKKQGLDALLQAVREGRVINPRGTEPINSKGMFEVLSDPDMQSRFSAETVKRTPWTRQFYPRRTDGPGGENIFDLIEWTRKNWQNLVLKPERGYSGKGVSVGGIHNDVDTIIERALRERNYIVQNKVPINLWTEYMPEFETEGGELLLSPFQTDFRCLFGPAGLYGFLGRYGGIPTNVGSGGGVQPLAVLGSGGDVGEATKHINRTIMEMDAAIVREALAFQKSLSLGEKFTYLLGPIRIALRPRLITEKQIKALRDYCRGVWSDCLVLEEMWHASELNVKNEMEPEELEIVRSQPWRGSSAIFASDGLFSFGAHINAD